jgi:hypothetical protein
MFGSSYETGGRRPFKMSTKKMEWMLAAGKDPYEKFCKTSKCRNPKCRQKLTWGDGSYDFDHRDNNPVNNSQKNCYLVCKVCHGKATKLAKRAIRGGWFGEIIGYETIKKRVGYKKGRRVKATRAKSKPSKAKSLKTRKAKRAKPKPLKRKDTKSRALRAKTKRSARTKSKSTKSRATKTRRRKRT